MSPLIASKSRAPDGFTYKRFVWVGRCGFGFRLFGREHQFYRDTDGSMGKPWTHYDLSERSERAPEGR